MCIVRIADVGGFFASPVPEMLARWYQVCIFSVPHDAHIDTRRRAPYKGTVKDLLKPRYIGFREAGSTEASVYLTEDEVYYMTISHIKFTAVRLRANPSMFLPR